MTRRGVPGGRPPGGALVTGAAGGLGRAIARALAAAGYQVHLTDVDADAVCAAADDTGRGAWGSVLDVADADACRRAAADTVSGAGSLDVWVNNAGILRTGPSWAHPEAERQALFAVNTFGTINGTVAALEVMRPAGRGHVLNVVSLAGLVAPPGETLYAATKHAALAFSLGTLLDLRQAGVRGVHVSALCPDGIWTPMLFDRVDDPQAAPSWAGTMLHPDDVARAAMRLLRRPRPVLCVPGFRGLAARAFDAWPRASVRLAPVMIAAARRKQRAFARRHAAQLPPPVAR